MNGLHTLSAKQIADMNDTTLYLVLDEHTLGYVCDAAPTLFGVLAGDRHGFNPNNGPTILFCTSSVRPATQADFERFRVSPPKRRLSDAPSAQIVGTNTKEH